MSDDDASDPPATVKNHENHDGDESPVVTLPTAPSSALAAIGRESSGIADDAARSTALSAVTPTMTTERQEALDELVHAWSFTAVTPMTTAATGIAAAVSNNPRRAFGGGEKEGDDDDDDDDNDEGRRAEGEKPGATRPEANHHKKRKSDDGAEVAELSYEVTARSLRNEIHELIEAAGTCFAKYEQAWIRCQSLEEELRVSQEEISRLRSADERNRKTIANLLCAKEAAMTEVRHKEANIRGDEMAAVLRAELSALTAKYDEATSALEEVKRSNALLEGELQHAKATLTKIKSEKLEVERKLRAASMSLAEWTAHQQRSSTMGDYLPRSSEADFYKKKTGELQDQLTRHSVLLGEKDRQIQELQRELNRNLQSSSHFNKGHKKPRST